MLEDRWLALCRKTGLGGADCWVRMETAYSAADRAYHNMGHIEDCLAQFDRHLELVADLVAVELAIWFHDVVYDTRASDNEERSAVVAVEFLGESNMGERVVDLIVATKHAGESLSGDALVLCDIDLSILGRAPERYREYAAAIRQEYGWVAEEDYVAGRTKVLEGFLARRRIYGTEVYGESYEEQARVNMREEIGRLKEGTGASPKE